MVEFRRPLALLAIVTLLGAACSPAAPATPAAPVGNPAPAAPTAVPVDKITVIQTTTVDTLDPHLSFRPDEAMVLARIYQPLVDRVPETSQPGPMLATSWKTVDPQTWDFTLKPGVTFTNGEPLDSAVVKFSFDRILNPDLKAPQRASLAGAVDSISVVDPMTIRIVTKGPYPLLLERLTTVRMVPPKYVAEKGNDAFGANPIGTGPYKFVEWKRGQSVTITRNDSYFGDKPAIKDVLFRPIAESSTALAELLNGSADLVVNVAPDQVDTVKKSGKADIFIQPAVNVLEIRMDALARGGPNPFTDKRVRQAASYSINKDAIAKTLLGGYSTVMATNIVPQMFGYDSSIKPIPYDPNKAKELLAAAGYANGFDVDFLWHEVTAFREPKTIAEAVASDLNKVGIRAKLRTVGATESTPLMNSGKAGPIFITNNVNGGGYDAGFGFFYLRKQYDASYYYSDELEALISKGEKSVDQNERKQIYSQIQKLLIDESPYIWGWSGFSLIGVSNKLDFKPTAGVDPLVHLIKPKR